MIGWQTNPGTISINCLLRRQLNRDSRSKMSTCWLTLESVHKMLEQVDIFSGIRN